MIIFLHLHQKLTFSRMSMPQCHEINVMTFDAECHEICFVGRKTNVMTLMSWDLENIMRFIFSGMGARLITSLKSFYFYFLLFFLCVCVCVGGAYLDGGRHSAPMYSLFGVVYWSLISRPSRVFRRFKHRSCFKRDPRFCSISLRAHMVLLQ